MPDSVQVLDAGWQMPTNASTKLPYADGIISFFEAGTSTPLEVFSDAALSVSLGVTVSCNSLGFPVSSGNAKVLIYTGPDAYKIRITSVVHGGTVFEADAVRGALDTSNFLTTAAVADKTIVNTSSNRTVTVADQGKLINANCTAGTLTITLDPAATLGSGFWVGVRHDGTANSVKIVGNGIDTFGYGMAVSTGFTLPVRGHTVYIVTDGTKFVIDSEAPEIMGRLPGRLYIADILSAPPVSPNPGDRYIVGAAPSGAWSAYSQNDIAEADGFGNWIRYETAALAGANSGLIAYVADEKVFYTLRGGSVGWTTGSPTVQRFTSGSGTYTPAAGVRYIRVRMVGGGGGGAAQATNGGANGTTTVFAAWTAILGNGGATAGGAGGAGGTGGVDGTGTLIARFPGEDGSATGATSSDLGGKGGASPFGGAGAMVFGAGTAAKPAKANTGSGGGGSRFGAGGGAGEYVEFFVYLPAAASYTVGAGGAGGAAGTTAGGNGAAGIIIVEEFG